MLMALAVAAILAAAWLVHALVIRPATAVRDGIVYATDQAGRAVAEVYRDGKRVARRLLDGEVTTRFSSYVHETRRVNKLVLVERTHLEYFHEAHTRGVSRAELDLLVPVEYAYFVDMADKSAWSMTMAHGELQVVAPPLQLQRPNPHWEARREFIRKGLLIRDEPAKMSALRDRVVAHAEKLARRPVRLAEARHAARESLANWIREWVEDSLLADYEVRAIAIRFADESDFPHVRYALPAQGPSPKSRETR
jgi:hypothetical protein